MAETISALHEDTFRKGSKTYYNSSRFFPPEVRKDVFVLYGFVRVADNYVDSIPQDAAGFHRFVADYRAAWAGTPTDDPIIGPFVELARRRGFDPAWTDAFLYSMELDLTKKNYDTLPETLEYIYGSAEVIGLYMAKLIGLPESAYPAAQMMGRSMQYINFIRDLNEDYGLGRRYLPVAGYDLKNFDKDHIAERPEEFRRFLRDQTQLYLGWQAEAEQGYGAIPRRYLAPIKTASDMYNWTARTIQEDPFVVFRRQVKPPKPLIFWTFLKNRFYRPARPAPSGAL